MNDVSEVRLTLAEIERLSLEALCASRVANENARSVARSIVEAEADGIQSHGLMRLPTYCEHALCGKVDGHARASVASKAAGALVVDARAGFAHPAIDLGFEELIPTAKQQGIAALAITSSYNCGVLGHHVQRLALEGLVGLGYVNTPAAIAPWGGTKPLFGTNPIACAVPRRARDPLVVDQSSSVIARGEVMRHARESKSIPEGWALDSEGAATTDPQAALAGSMLPAGGYKGAGLALIVEILAAALTGAAFSFNASSFADNKGGPPGTGQLFIAIDPAAFLDEPFIDRIERLVDAMCSQDGVRLPGDRRLAARAHAAEQGIAIHRTLYEDIVRRGR